MIIKTFYEKRADGVNLYRIFSDKNVYIKQDQTGAEYSEAIDVENAPYTYTETDKPIEGEPQDEAEQKAEAYDYLTGRSNGNE
jgi:hypothetical protein